MSGAWPFELMEGLAAAFPTEGAPGCVVSDLALESHDGAAEIEAVLRGQTWTEVPQEGLDAQAKHIIALSPESFAYYLPAFLRAAIKNPEGDAATYLFYALAPLDQFDAFYQGTARMFSPAQAAVVAKVLHHLEPQESFAPMHDQFGPALEVWERRAADES